MSDTEKVNLTMAFAERATCPAGSDRIYIYDAKTPALALCVTSTGSKSFYLYRRISGRPERVRIGGYPDISVDTARKQAAGLNGEIAKGNDPADLKRKARTAWTVEQLFGHYLEQHAKPHKRTWQDDQDQYDRYLAGWTTRRVASIHEDDVRDLHAKIGAKHGKFSANRLLALLSSMFNNARLPNPTKGVKKFAEASRERFLQPDEIPQFLKALDEEPHATIRDYVWISLLTGARRSNVQAMRWDQLNLSSGLWIIPGDDSKNAQPLNVALVPQAVAILKERKAAAEKGAEWVFPGHGKTGHLMEPKAAWKALLKRAGISDLRLHDLRRTFGAWQAAAGVSELIIGKSLGHKSPASTRVYARLNLAPVRASVNLATDAILAARTLNQKGA